MKAGVQVSDIVFHCTEFGLTFLKTSGVTYPGWNGVVIKMSAYGMNLEWMYNSWFSWTYVFNMLLEEATRALFIVTNLRSR